MSYAEGTSVSVEQTRAEIERTLRKYGADAFAYAQDGPKAAVMFRLAERQYRFNLLMPDPQDKVFWVYHRGGYAHRRTETEGVKRWEQACRQRWRALLLVIKAKLEATALGITSIEDEFLAQTIMPDKQTVSEWLRPQLEEAYRLGHMPRALLLEDRR